MECNHQVCQLSTKRRPKTQANAAAAFEKHQEKKKAKAQSYKKKRKIHTLVLSLMADNDSDDDQSDTKQKIVQAIVATLSPTKSPKRKSKFEPAKTFSLLGDVIGLNTVTKPLLEIGICRELPHFSFFVGKQDSDFHPKLQPAYDTCACLNCGYLPYHTSIAKSYPRLSQINHLFRRRLLSYYTKRSSF